MTSFDALRDFEDGLARLADEPALTRPRPRLLHQGGQAPLLRQSMCLFVRIRQSPVSDQQAYLLCSRVGPDLLRRTAT